MAQTCPHCGRTMRSGSPEHAGKCLKNPAVFAATRAALDDGTGVIKPRTVYHAASQAGSVPSAETLLLRLGAWTAVARYFGLCYPQARAGPRISRSREPQHIDWAGFDAALDGLVADAAAYGARAAAV